jgi:hypothetical protein
MQSSAISCYFLPLRSNYLLSALCSEKHSESFESTSGVAPNYRNNTQSTSGVAPNYRITHRVQVVLLLTTEITHRVQVVLLLTTEITHRVQVVLLLTTEITHRKGRDCNTQQCASTFHWRLLLTSSGSICNYYQHCNIPTNLKTLLAYISLL